MWATSTVEEAMTDDRLTHELRELPRLSPSSGFAARVDARIARARRARTRRMGWSLAAVTGALAVVLGVVASRPPGASVPKGASEEISELRADLQNLRAELAELHAREREGMPVVYLGGTERLDLVLDVARIPIRDASFRLGGKEQP
jgi:hypothetical protein